MKFSIITVVYNNEDSVEEAIKSVLSQTYDNIEFIVVDGLSKDGTLQIINKYRIKINKFISEKDRSNYDAYNKGLKLATGDIIGFLNSDDLFENDNIISSIAEKFKNNPNIDMVYGNIKYVNKDYPNIVVRKWKSLKYYDKFFENGNVPPHPGLFIKSYVYKESGNFDLNFNLVADHDFMFRVFKIKQYRSLFVDKYYVKMRLGGRTNQSWKNIYLQNIEILNVWKKYNLKAPIYLMPIRIIKRLIQYI